MTLGHDTTEEALTHRLYHPPSGVRDFIPGCYQFYTDRSKFGKGKLTQSFCTETTATISRDASCEEVVAWARENLLGKDRSVSVFVSIPIGVILKIFGKDHKEELSGYQNLRLKIQGPSRELAFVSRFMWIPPDGGYKMVCFEMPLKASK